MPLGKLGKLGKIGQLGSPGSKGKASVTAPVLILASIVGNTVTFAIDIDNIIVAGDTIRLQIQTPPGGNWSSPVFNNTHVITAPEDAANEVDLIASLASGNYDARSLVRKNGVDSPWSNTVTFTI